MYYHLLLDVPPRALERSNHLADVDPHGFGITVLAMGIVFFCLALLWGFFTLFGLVMRHRETAQKAAQMQPIKPVVKTVEKTMEIGHKTNVILKDGLQSKGIDMETYMAVIAMAIKQYQDDVHDVESGVITIKSHETEWTNELSQMTQGNTAVVRDREPIPVLMGLS
jgi:Na+-transporting methylmalonyl-CoA/oxaloacetate decarboxylase gamma subunit